MTMPLENGVGMWMATYKFTVLTMLHEGDIYLCADANSKPYALLKPSKKSF